jgi:hypothetical protein
VEVVEHDRGRALQLAQGGQQPAHERCSQSAAAGLEMLPEALAVGQHGLQGPEQVVGEHDRVVMVLPQREGADRELGVRRRPLRQQHRLAVSGRSHDQRHAARAGRIDAPDQPRARHRPRRSDSGATGGDGLGHDHPHSLTGDRCRHKAPLLRLR